MVIKCALSVPEESIKFYARQFSELPPLPGDIIKKGPYVNNKEGAAHQVITLYHFNKSKLAEAQEIICKLLAFWRDLPGFTLSVHTYGPRPYHLNLEKGGAIEKYPGLSSMVECASVALTT